MQGIEKDLEYLEQVWTITKEWEELWDSWKVGKFQELVTTDMETTSQLLFKRLNKLVREVKVRRLHSFRVNQLLSIDYTIVVQNIQTADKLIKISSYDFGIVILPFE